MLKRVHENGWLYLGHRSTEWCPRCGTSISAHELSQSGVYQDRARSLAFRPLPAARSRARVAGRLDDDPVDAAGERRGCGEARRRVRPPGQRRVGRRRTLSRPRPSSSGDAARSSSAGATGARSTSFRPAAEVEHRVIPWDEVSLEEGTGIVHIAPGAGQEDFELGRLHDLPVLVPVDEAGRFYDDYGWLHGLSTTEAADQIVGWLGERGDAPRGRPPPAPLSALLALRHAADLARHRRLADLGRGAAAAAPARERGHRVDARLHGQADGRLAAQHGRLEHLQAPLLRPAASLLPLRVRPPERARVKGGAARAGDRRDRPARGAEAAVDRRGADHAARRAARRSGAVVEVGDVWLDAGIVPFSTLGWQNRSVPAGGLRDRRSERTDQGRPPRSRLLGGVVPGRLGVRDARADPTLVLLAALHVGGADGPRAVQARARLREDARRDRA